MLSTVKYTVYIHTVIFIMIYQKQSSNSICFANGVPFIYKIVLWFERVYKRINLTVHQLLEAEWTKYLLTYGKLQNILEYEVNLSAYVFQRIFKL